MSNALPVFFDPWRFSDLTKQFRGEIKLAEMPRLTEAVLRLDDDAKYELDLFRDKHRVRIKGRAYATAILTCQRCLDECEVPLSPEISLALIEDIAEADTLAEEIEPLLFEKGTRLRSAELIEDELLLALPQIATHPGTTCPGKMLQFTSPIAKGERGNAAKTAQLETDLRTKNPFDVLATLKKVDKQDSEGENKSSLTLKPPKAWE